MAYPLRHKVDYAFQNVINITNGPIVPVIPTRGPTPLQEYHPHNIRLRPPCFMVFVVYFSLNCFIINLLANSNRRFTCKLFSKDTFLGLRALG